MKDLEALEQSASQVTHASQLRPIVAKLIAHVKAMASVQPVEGVLLESAPDPRLDEYGAALKGIGEALDALALRVEALEENVTMPGEPALKDEDKTATNKLKKASK